MKLEDLIVILKDPNYICECMITLLSLLKKNLGKKNDPAISVVLNKLAKKNIEKLGACRLKTL